MDPPKYPIIRIPSLARGNKSTIFALASSAGLSHEKLIMTKYHKDVSKLLLIGCTVITQNKFESKTETQLKLDRVSNFTIKKLLQNSNFLCVKTL